PNSVRSAAALPRGGHSDIALPLQGNSGSIDRLSHGAPGRGRQIVLALFQNCRLLDPEASEPRDGMSVLVEGEHIREVSDRVIAAPSATPFDLRGLVLMPGLIDAH